MRTTRVKSASRGDSAVAAGGNLKKTSLGEGLEQKWVSLRTNNYSYHLIYKHCVISIDRLLRHRWAQCLPCLRLLRHSFEQIPVPLFVTQSASSLLSRWRDVSDFDGSHARVQPRSGDGIISDSTRIIYNIRDEDVVSVANILREALDDVVSYPWQDRPA